MKILSLCAVAAVIAVVTLLICPSAFAFHKDNYLRNHLPSKSGWVFCSDSSAEWSSIEDKLFGGGSILGYTNLLDGNIYLNPTICHNIHKSPLHSSGFPEASATLYHEWVHSAFKERSLLMEGNAECVSLYIYQQVLVKFWHLSRGYALRAYKTAWAEHLRRAFFFPAYRGPCSFKDGMHSF